MVFKLHFGIGQLDLGDCRGLIRGHDEIGLVHLDVALLKVRGVVVVDVVQVVDQLLHVHVEVLMQVVHSRYLVIHF